ncbi:RNA-binding signal recognition particle subunit srp14 [Dimargaris cristalligena]|uniref:Signal recognition particle subunit SRP14 n=1 Tax=Dimargaris cristalligena TaxID=215637 RepID=A0A4Q0A3W6_9FUNG|nr:RNA-binding signal recognition particle subunit srp14 [Dimargaris cristalligena]RKP40102.1 signal recognition particle, SRP9/SRP14 subunit [Dimargaris cristalligena]|eukprot:RKP40102.1 signal recognition particle, SRP9/SRP14 subunit [Dimargaris cristalligena]
MFVDNEKFLTELAAYFRKASKSGSVTVTSKRYDAATRHQSPAQPIVETNLTMDPHPTSSEPGNPQHDYLVRAAFKGDKISTVVTPEDYTQFQSGYLYLLKLQMKALKVPKKRKATGSAKKSGSSKK